MLDICLNRRKIAAQFYALPKCFSKVEVLEYEVAENHDNLTCLKLRTAYTEPLVGTKEIKHLVSLAYDPKSPVSDAAIPFTLVLPIPCWQSFWY